MIGAKSRNRNHVITKQIGGPRHHGDLCLLKTKFTLLVGTGYVQAYLAISIKRAKRTGQFFHAVTSDDYYKNTLLLMKEAILVM